MKLRLYLYLLTLDAGPVTFPSSSSVTTLLMVPSESWHDIKFSWGVAMDKLWQFMSPSCCCKQDGISPRRCPMILWKDGIVLSTAWPCLPTFIVRILPFVDVTNLSRRPSDRTINERREGRHCDGNWSADAPELSCNYSRHSTSSSWPLLSSVLVQHIILSLKDLHYVLGWLFEARFYENDVCLLQWWRAFIPLLGQASFSCLVGTA